jgi:hypothetical protein
MFSRATVIQIVILALSEANRLSKREEGYSVVSLDNGAAFFESLWKKYGYLGVDDAELGAMAWRAHVGLQDETGL